jgi:hypothetical protein
MAEETSKKNSGVKAKSFGSMTNSRFDYVLPHMSGKVLPENIDAARRILVGNEKAAVVARDMGKNPETVRYTARLIWNKHLALPGDTPNGWKTIEITLPEDLIEFVRQLESKERLKLAKGSDNAKSDGSK